MAVIKHQIFIAAALLVGAAIGYCLRSDAPRAEQPNGHERLAPAAIQDRGADQGREALRRRVRELETLLAELSAASAKTSQPVAVERKDADAAPDRRHGPPSAKEMRARMEKLRQEDPKRFEEITKRMAQFRQRRLDRANRKLDFLATIDTSTMTDEQKAAHDQYQNLIAQREELEEKMHAEDCSDDERDALFGKMHELDRQMRASARQERETLIDQTAKALGFSGEEAKTVGDTIREVISSTETGHGMPPPPSGK